MRIGIIGLPQSGKTTLFHSLTESSGEEESGRKKDTNLGIVKVPDKRLDWLHSVYPTAKKSPATIEYLDVAGLSKGSTQQKGFQDRFLANLKNIDALLVVLRFFENEAVPHIEGGIDPVRDAAIIEDEFYLSDMTILENRIERLRKEVKKTKEKERQTELELLEKCLTALESETPLRNLDLSETEEKMLRGFQFLTAKPLLILLNIDEGRITEEATLRERFAGLGSGKNRSLSCASAELEMEVSQLPDDQRRAFEAELGIKEPALNKIIRDSYRLLGLISFFTAGDKEVRAWTIRDGSSAQIAAGAIHSDMQRGFIRAEVVAYETLRELGSFAKCKEEGRLRLEGKDYRVKDGDVITFRFNV